MHAFYLGFHMIHHLQFLGMDILQDYLAMCIWVSYKLSNVPACYFFGEHKQHFRILPIVYF